MTISEISITSEIGKLAGLEWSNRSGDPLLFLHDIGGSHLSFKPLWESDIVQKYRCLFIDLLGFGHSSKPISSSFSIEDHSEFLFPLVKHIENKTFKIIGIGFGAAVGLNLLKRSSVPANHLIILGMGSLRPGFNPDFCPVSSRERDFSVQEFNLWLTTRKARGDDVSSLTLASTYGIFRSIQSAQKFTKQLLNEHVNLPPYRQISILCGQDDLAVATELFCSSSGQESSPIKIQPVLRTKLDPIAENSFQTSMAIQIALSETVSRAE